MERKREQLSIDPARFWRHVVKTETCWLWRGLAGGATPAFQVARVAGKSVNRKVTRVALALMDPNWLMPFEDEIVRPTCGELRCVNPAHLLVLPGFRITDAAIASRPKPTRESDRARFHTMYAVEPNGCWMWLTRTELNPYGSFWLDRNDEKAHIASVILFHGPYSGRLVVRHKCDRPGCVNPDHLELGTWRDNSEDMVKRGRQARGERTSRHVYTAQQVAQIKGLYREQDGCLTALAHLYGGTPTAIWAVVNEKSWNHVAADPECLAMTVEYPTGKTDLRPAQIEEIRAAYDAGLSLREVCARFQLKYHRVWTICVKTRQKQGERPKRQPKRKKVA